MKPEVPDEANAPPPPPPQQEEADKDEDFFKAAKKFKKVKGSNPQQVRQQFLEYQMGLSGSSLSKSQSNTSVKIRPVREVLKRIKFDGKYNAEDYVVGYIDRKAGILEKSVKEWEKFGQEELMAYVRNVKDDHIVWDKTRKIDLVFGTAKA